MALPRVSQFPASILTFIREARDELKKVSWPSREQTIRYSVIVVVSSLAVGAIIGGIDYMFTLLIESIINNYGN